MENVVYVTGHKNPDSDSICAAYGYAELKNKTSDLPAVPVRLGNVNAETQFILDYFGVKAPKLLETVKLKVEDLEIDKISPILPSISLKMAWNIMRDNHSKSLPVVDENERLLGILSISNLTSAYMDIWDNNILGKSNTSIENIIDTLAATPIYINENVKTFDGKIAVTAMQPESLREIVDEGDIAIVGDRPDVQQALIDIKTSLIIVTGSHKLDENLLSEAKENGVTVISTPHDSFTASRLIVQSIPVGYVMATENLISFSNDELVEDIKEVMAETRYHSYPVTDADNKVVGTVARYHLISNHKKKVIQVDHNERGQSVDGLEEAEVLEIIDHHRVADIQTNNPIYFRNEPIGSSSSIVAKCYFEHGVTPSKEVAGLLCGAIISDTLLFKSPTCTEQDRTICTKLAEIAGIQSLEDFAKEMFKAGTSLVGKSVAEIFNQDFKPFSMGEAKVGVAQVNTMDIEGFMPLKDEMLSYMASEADNKKYDVVMLLLTDILTEGSQVLVAGNRPDYVEKTFNVTLKDSMAFLPGVLSRKKQVIPPLTNVVNSMK
ncbi:putative manganese-dependent inorganic diphosphatase [Clostridium saccharobutylicum]|uniref:inorganic diphosphatase n=1 Tax=Clostridium saccharobutylicum DSM 13864 TaxID=1345695 RepID=U5MZF2_CLOSA|nr:putative manganese-dependent inorganic diphosphatase [Clostridium saccharobutylicum]AGX44872.1 cobalt-dependent inorganic pyrophosphatase [Clostridium saccharobutylicum DSM 13864]AQR92154.1 cobalt-dependent inorganic pyrophosphatase [Clostridium saccharobutylicum]AQS02056.1 cobalt-dependent inorganic pyrophosphatase [Clostridium saccharobutylicum]AQS11660.1 cobalt-dependent inorganic pyrophosphatase [Clostridium saccharobutylicum]AQS16039.1 cobalt-dependent inorganic pyrophosphatase [Clostr